ncbi:hypothetical protein GWK91_11045 [Virgibacillus sp. MSP4-1]|uniref:transposase n=1 Tax=Virgibacillus sp. MSP4-1 TaxID=2700081 RepID=UPI0003AA1536|nr:transposase [Virgibacillus sp. MSP4-1]QHS23459.1 hypothetical protein GWK91_11045 [Virgibacillus sp. MSP4-1]
MGRQKRFWFPGAKYTRGVRRTTLFHEDDDFLEYLRILKEVKQSKPFTLHAYSPMTNHVHLQMQPHEHHPGRILQQVHLIMPNTSTKI